MRAMIGTSLRVTAQVRVLFLQLQVPLDEIWTVLYIQASDPNNAVVQAEIFVNQIPKVSIALEMHHQVAVVNRKIQGGSILSMYGTPAGPVNSTFAYMALIDRVKTGA